MKPRLRLRRDRKNQELPYRSSMARMKCWEWWWMRCPKPKVRGSINQLLPTGPLGTGDLWMGRVVKPEEPWSRWNPYSGLPPTTGMLVLWSPQAKDSYFVLGCLLLVAFYDMQGIQRTIWHTRTYWQGKTHQFVSVSGRFDSCTHLDWLCRICTFLISIL